MPVELEEIGPDDAAAMGAYTEVDAATGAADAPWLPTPTAYRTEMEMRHGWDGEVGRFFLARDGGEVVGTARLDASEWDNLDLAWVELAVTPSRRRRGHGTAVLAGLLEVARGMGRHIVCTHAWESDAVRTFAERTGFTLGSQEVMRRMDLTGVDLDAVRALRDEAAAAASAYELLRLPGRTPDDLLAAVAEMTGAINDAPMGDLEYEDEVYPPQRIRDYEEHSAAAGWRMYRLVARHRATGELGGHTVVQVDVRGDGPARQHDTSVVAGHRGHRLGLLLKAEMVLWLAEAEPAATALDTWNAEANGHMIGVNEQLGYRVLGRELEYQRRLPL